MTKGPYVINSNFVKYETEEDGTHINFETYRHIQNKQFVMTGYDHKFKWTGSIPPVISSKLQSVKDHIIKGEEGQYDAIRLELKKPIFYNEFAMIHIQALLDDTNKQSQPYVEFRVDYPIQMLHFRVILKHKTSEFKTPAILKRKKINHQIGGQAYAEIKSVSFNRDCKTYEYHLIEPEIGYFYRLEWEK